MGCSSSWTAPVWIFFHRLRVFRKRSSVNPAQGSKPCQQTCSSIFHGSTGPARSLLQHHRVTASFGHPPALCEMPHGGTSASPWSMSCSVTWALALGAPPLLPHSPWCLQSCYSHILSLLFVFVFIGVLFYSNMLPQVNTSAAEGSALPSSGCVLPPAGTGFIRHGQSFCPLFTKEKPSPLQNLATQI